MPLCRCPRFADPIFSVGSALSFAVEDANRWGIPDGHRFSDGTFVDDALENSNQGLMMWAWFAVLKHWNGGDSWFGAWVNSFIHVIMYYFVGPVDTVL